MKAPWKFLAELVSGRKPADIAIEPAQENRKLIEIEARPAVLPQLSAPEPDIRVQDEEKLPDDTSEAAASTEVEEKVEHPEPEVAEKPVIEPEDDAGLQNALPDEAGVDQPQPEIARVKAARRPRKAPVVVVETAVVAAAEDLPAPAAPAGNTVFDEAANLDAEIKQLRDQLAQKLRLQNAQLKKMIERYERS